MTGIFLVAIIAVISVSDLISIDSINWPAELKQSICDQLQITLVFDRYKSLYVIAASICTVTTFPSDIKNHVLPYIRQRTDFDSKIVCDSSLHNCYHDRRIFAGRRIPESIHDD